MVLTAKNFCCFLPLKMGTLIIGLLEVVAGLGYLIGGSIIVAEPPEYRIYFITVRAAGSSAVGSLMIVSGILLLLSAVVLLVGAVKDYATLLVPWMTYMLTFIVANSFLNIIAASQYIQMGYQSSGTANAVVSVLAFLLQLYFLYVVNGLYTELKGTAPLNDPTTQSAPRPWTTPA